MERCYDIDCEADSRHWTEWGPILAEEVEEAISMLVMVDYYDGPEPAVEAAIEHLRNAIAAATIETYPP